MDGELMPLASDPPPATVPPSVPGTPVVTLGPVAAGVARAGGQTGIGALIVQGGQIFNLTHLTAEQATWLVTALTLAVAWLQNRLEARKGRRLVGSGTYP